MWTGSGLIVLSISCTWIQGRQLTSSVMFWEACSSWPRTHDTTDVPIINVPADGGGHTCDFRQKTTIPDRRCFVRLINFGLQEIDFGQILYDLQNILLGGDLDLKTFNWYAFHYIIFTLFSLKFIQNINFVS